MATVIFGLAYLPACFAFGWYAMAYLDRWRARRRGEP